MKNVKGKVWGIIGGAVVLGTMLSAIIKKLRKSK